MIRWSLVRLRAFLICRGWDYMRAEEKSAGKDNTQLPVMFQCAPIALRPFIMGKRASSLSILSV